GRAHHLPRAAGRAVPRREAARSLGRGVHAVARAGARAAARRSGGGGAGGRRLGAGVDGAAVGHAAAGARRGCGPARARVPAVRRALAIGLDRARLVADVRHGLARPIGAPALGGSDAAPPAYDLAAAHAALDAAGLPRAGGDGPRTRNGRPIRLALLVPRES